MRDWMTDVKARLKGAQLDGMTEQEIAEELAQHLEDRYTDLRARGLTEEAARAQALAELGEGDDLAWDVRRVTTVRDTPLPIGRPSVGNWLAGLASDIGFGARMLLRAPIYAVVAVLIMALGIGVTTVIFIAVNSLLLQPPSGVRDPEQLAALFTSDYSGPRFGSSSWPDVEAVSEAGIFDGVAAYALQTFNVLGNGWQSVGMGEIVSPDYFRALGVRPAAGRFFAPDELTPGKPAGVAVISHALWREQYDASPAAIGSVIHVRGEPLTVIGVAPANFGGTLRGLRTHLWLPVSAPQRVTGVDHRHRGNRGFRVTARLRDGVDIAAAQEQLNVIAARLHQEYPQQWTDVNERSRVFTILPEADARLPAQSRGAVLGFLGLFVVAVLAVLVIACSNVANLTLARAASRRSEMGVRLALGATRGQVVRHLLAENLLLACIGGATGVLLAVWLVRALAAVRVPGLHVTLQVTLDWYVLAFAVGITLATGILFGLAPALRASRAPAPLLKEDARAGTRGRLRHALVVLQVAASLVLLTGGGLLLRSLRAGQQIETGYRAENVAIAYLDLDVEGYTDERAAALHRTLLERVEGMPGVTMATLAQQVPLGMGWSRSWIIVDGYRPSEGEDMEYPRNRVAPGYFRTMGVQLRAGRDFTAADRDGAPPVVIVSEAFVRRFWPGESGLGKRVGLAGRDAPFAEVIGIAPDAKYRALDAGEPEPYLYYPYHQWPTTTMQLLARTTDDPEQLATMLRNEIRALAPTLPPPDIRTFREHVAFAEMPHRIAALLMSGLGLLGTSIALIGLYGLIAFSAVQRTREFGIRIALGAVESDVRRLVFREALWLVAVGIAVGVPVASTLAFGVRSLLLVPPLDPVAFLGVPALLLGAALLASYAPARRATAADPATALRAE